MDIEENLPTSPKMKQLADKWLFYYYSRAKKGYTWRAFSSTTRISQHNKNKAKSVYMRP